MEIRRADLDDVAELARLLWWHASSEEQAAQPREEFEVGLTAWWSAHAQSHLAFVAPAAGGALIGMAWLALLPRIPRPGTTMRRSADIQSVFVIPEQRGQGVGSALVDAATTHAFGVGVSRVTVSSGRRAVPVYERLGFAASPRLLEKTAD
ncbi:N-acetyltransferase [Flexivirga endophytica]|uniref:N-acetyltransferase n=1 Tax=Flexivirga endophytica TaxID=1849103 RepID=A0A916WZK6_9MICO|nr:GNAT family N-acetyltransferase [Flexivirga endophytica]GGB45718.1 N-acetyltransferase [Flexivirga endophytica]GHB66322.1 N-acetyltransferase [Flexivirga endophytica]